MSKYFTPHTPEWFSALKACNPEQASMTKQILDLAGRNDVCSVCGDESAKDYKVVGEKFAQDTDATIRLCDDCRKIRTSMHGESFTLLKPPDASPLN